MSSSDNNSNLFLSDDFSSSPRTPGYSLDTLNTPDLDSQNTLALNNQPSDDPDSNGFWDDLTDFTNIFDKTPSVFDKTPSVYDKLSSGFCFIRNKVTSLKEANAVLQINLQSSIDEKNSQKKSFLQKIESLENSLDKEFTKTHINCLPLSTLNTHDIKHKNPNCHSLRSLANAFSSIPNKDDITDSPLFHSLDSDIQSCIENKNSLYIKLDFHNKRKLQNSLFTDLDSQFKKACSSFSNNDKQILIQLSNDGELNKQAFIHFAESRKKRKFSSRSPSSSLKKQKKIIN